MLLLQRLILTCCLLSLIIYALPENNMSEEPKSGKHDEIARVKIKVFRGPMEERNGETFAKWGFWIKQPRS